MGSALLSRATPRRTHRARRLTRRRRRRLGRGCRFGRRRRLLPLGLRECGSGRGRVNQSSRLLLGLPLGFLCGRLPFGLLVLIFLLRLVRLGHRRLRLHLRGLSHRLGVIAQQPEHRDGPVKESFAIGAAPGLIARRTRRTRARVCECRVAELLDLSKKHLDGPGAHESRA